MNAKLLLLALAAAFSLPCAAQTPPAAPAPAQPAADLPAAVEAAMKGQLLGKDGDDWSKYLADTASGSVSAFSLLGIPGEAVATVENVRDVVVAVKGFGSSTTGVGISVTPARTSFLGMNLQSYANNNLDRVLGAVAFGYAQGAASIANKTYERRAFSVETNYFFNRSDDPFIAVWDAYSTGKCGSPLSSAKPDSEPGKPAAEPRVEGPAAKPAALADNDKIVEAAKAKAEQCRSTILGNLRWNRSQISGSFATGQIRPEDGSSSQQSVGRSMGLGLVYGFDQSDYLKEKAAAYLTLRRTINEPILDTLASGSVEHKSKPLAVLRVVAGSRTFRALVEASNAKASDVTLTQRTFKQAAGFDYRLGEALWLNFRIGKQRKFDGSGGETTSVFNVSYSPSALLK